MARERVPGFSWTNKGCVAPAFTPTYCRAEREWRAEARRHKTLFLIPSHLMREKVCRLAAADEMDDFVGVAGGDLGGRPAVTGEDLAVEFDGYAAHGEAEVFE